MTNETKPAEYVTIKGERWIASENGLWQASFTDGPIHRMMISGPAAFAELLAQKARLDAQRRGCDETVAGLTARVRDLEEGIEKGIELARKAKGHGANAKRLFDALERASHLLEMEATVGQDISDLLDELRPIYTGGA